MNRERKNRTRGATSKEKIQKNHFKSYLTLYAYYLKIVGINIVRKLLIL